jgi:hypothetical protein
MRLNIHQRRSIAWHAAGDSQICRLVDKNSVGLAGACEYWLMPANASEMLGSAGRCFGVLLLCVDWPSSVVQRPPVRPFRFMCVQVSGILSKYDCAKLSSLYFFWGPELVVPMPKLNCHREVCGDRREKQMGHGDNQDAHQMQVAFRRRKRHR